MRFLGIILVRKNINTLQVGNKLSKVISQNLLSERRLNGRPRLRMDGVRAGAWNTNYRAAGQDQIGWLQHIRERCRKVHIVWTS